MFCFQPQIAMHKETKEEINIFLKKQVNQQIYIELDTYTDVEYVGGKSVTFGLLMSF